MEEDIMQTKAAFRLRSVYAIFLSLFIALPVLIPPASAYAESGGTLPARQAEYLDRGLVAVLLENGVFLSWRYLNTDPDDIAFNVYKNGKKVNGSPISDVTNYVDTTGADSSLYQISTVINGTEQLLPETVSVWFNNYLPIPLDKPSDGRTKDGTNYTYIASDASVADLDGDGAYEIVFLWNPSNQKDNSNSGYTGNVYMDAVKLDGTRLWRIDLGVNIRAGAHYSQFMVYDLNGDGKAEVVVKTADGTRDGKGNAIGDPARDYRNSSGYILEGPEYLTLFNGETGEAVSTVEYDPPRGVVNDWGDNYGNRVDRFLAAVAYLDGKTPSVIFSRGYYTRTVLAAFDYTGGSLVKRWTFDTKVAGSQYEGQGNHGLSVLDVDQDGKDEIFFGALALDDDGTVLYSTGLGHGDAMHAGKLNPNREGYQILSVHEHTSAAYGIEMHDAATGEIIWGEYTGKDTGRGMSADIDPNYPGYESWASTIVDGLMEPITRTYSAAGEAIYEMSDSPRSTNFAIWWDGDLQRELFDHQWDSSTAKGVPLIYKWDYQNKKLNEIFRATGTLTNNHSKGNPALQADLLGDWREELLLRSEDSTEYRLYTTTIPTAYRIPPLMQDPVYRLGVAWQNVGYNQPPHTGFYLGTEAAEFPKANIYLTGGSKSLEPVYHFDFGSATDAGKTSVQNTPYSEQSGYGFGDPTGITVSGSHISIPQSSKFMVDLPNANYKVTVKLGDEAGASNTGIVTEYVQKLANTHVTAGESQAYAYDIALVDGQLDFMFTGTANAVQEIIIEKYPAQAPGASPTIYLAGDSTMQSYSWKQAPQEGWGQQFSRYFTSDVVIKNTAIGGRSSKSFIVDGRLDTVLNQIRPGDYFFVSFGHNDASAGIPDRYASPEDYKMYLARYIQGARQRGATPVLLTPVGRRDFNLVTQEFNVSFRDYVNASKEVAEELHVTLIDLSQLSIAHYNKIGLAATEDLFLYTNPGQYPYFPSGVNDNTHFKTYGAKVIAGLVAGAVKELNLGISPYVIDPDEEIPEPEPEPQYYFEDFEGDPASVEYAIVNASGIAGTMSGQVVEQSGNKVMSFVGSGSGNRARVFRLFDAVNGDVVHVNFDWHSGNVGASPSEGHLTLMDASENYILTLYTTTGSSTKIGYFSGYYEPSYGSGNIVIPQGQMTNITKNQWINVDAKINFADKTIDLTLTSLADSSITERIENIPLSAGTSYANNVRALRFLGTRKSGAGTLSWTTHIDNVRMEGTDLAPQAGDQTALVALYTEAKAKDVTGYTEASIAVLNRALEAAEQIIGTEATQAQVDHVFHMLNVALESLTSEPKGDVSEYRFDFGPGEAAAGYTKVDAKRAYVEGNGYGFADTNLVVDENRNTGNTLTEDFTRVNGTSFLVEMKPANYRVTMTIGDEAEATNVAVVTEQMNKVPVRTVARGDYTEVTYDIALIDGVFNFDFSGNSPKINALTIERIGANGAGEKPIIYLASDSTVANYAESYRPQAGWGETLGQFFDLGQIGIENRAVGGLSSKTFLVGGHLNHILLDIREGDYLFMQWSHNDSTPSRPERYLTPEQFKVYLKEYINGAVQRKATPVLVTPVNRRDFNGDILNKSFPDYVKAMKETAAETGTLLIDLNQASWEHFQELGPEGTKGIFLWVNGTEDNTHLQMNGAIKVSELVAGLVKESNLPIAAFVKLQTDVRVTGVSVAPTTLNLTEGESSQLTAAVEPWNATNKSVSWRSSNPVVTDVSDSGLVTAKQEGTAVISATTIDGGFTAETQVTVTSAPSGTETSYRLTGPGQVLTGETFQVTYGLSNVTDAVYAKSVTIHYDPAYLEFVGENTLIEGFTVVGSTYGTGTMRLILANAGTASPVKGTLDLLTLTFNAKNQPGNTQVSLSGIVLGFQDGIEQTVEQGNTLSINIMEPVPPADKSQLAAAIAEASSAAASAKVLNPQAPRFGYYPQDAIDSLNAAIAAAQLVYDTSSATQEQVDEALNVLNQALVQFRATASQKAGVGDLAIIAARYGADSSAADWSSLRMYDFNSDEKLDLFDLVSMAQRILN
jgi:large repetitive protein